MATHKKRSQFLALLNRYQPVLVLLCETNTDRQEESVSDLFQEIACALWEAMPRFEHRSAESTWVYGVALNVIRLHHRRRRHAPRFVKIGQEMLDRIAEGRDNELVERLYELIDRLDTDDKALITLYLARVPYAEVARTYGTTVSAIKHRIDRLKKKLKQMNEHEE